MADYLTTLALALVVFVSLSNSQLNQYEKTTGTNGEDIWRSTSDFVPELGVSFGTITMGTEMSVEFDFTWHGRSYDPHGSVSDCYENFFRVGFDGSLNNCDSSGHRYPAFSLTPPSQGNLLHVALAEINNCYTARVLTHVGAISVGQEYHIRIYFNQTTVTVDVDSLSHSLSRTGTPLNYIGSQAPIWWMTNSPSSFPNNNCIDRGNGTFRNIVITSRGFPTVAPTQQPSESPTEPPTVNPSVGPSKEPSISPSLDPTSNPSANPSLVPTQTPSYGPSEIPSSAPSSTSPPTVFPTYQPSEAPSNIPSADPTETRLPSLAPSAESRNPSTAPTLSPSENPSDAPSKVPTRKPTATPSKNPTLPPFASTVSTTEHVQTETTIEAVKSEQTEQNADEFLGLSLWEIVSIAASVGVCVLCLCLFIAYKRCVDRKAQKKINSVSLSANSVIRAHKQSIVRAADDSDDEQQQHGNIGMAVIPGKHNPAPSSLHKYRSYEEGAGRNRAVFIADNDGGDDAMINKMDTAGMRLTEDFDHEHAVGMEGDAQTVKKGDDYNEGDLDYTNYIEWTQDDVLHWVVTLENGRFECYAAMLAKVFAEQEFDGSCLEHLQKADIMEWGIKKFKDRLSLFQHIQQLITGNDEQEQQADAQNEARTKFI